jgi:hypothetical protein
VDVNERFGEFDIIIVGSGPAGLSAARKALRLGKRVLNLDWGPHEFPHYSALLESSDVRSTGGLGGTAQHWGGQFGTLSESDKANWKILSGCDPNFFSKLENAQKSLCAEMGLDYSKFLSYENERLSKETLNQRECITVVPNEVRILKIFVDTVSDSNFCFFSGMKLLRIEILRGGSRVLHFENESIEIGQLPLLIATGCIESTRIMHQSLVSNDQTLPRNFGDNLSDHPNTYGSTYEILWRPKKLPPEIFADGCKRKYEVSRYHPDMDIFQSGIFEIRKEVKKPTLNPFKGKFFGLKNLVSIFCFISFRHELSMQLRTRYQLWYQIEQSRNANSMLTFQDNSMVANWTLSEKDIEMFTVLQESGEAEMMKYSVKKLMSPKVDPHFKSIQAFHPSGTMPFGNEPEESITNLNGQAFRIPNTWVASSALFPTSGWFNPSLIIMAFGCLAVEDIFKNEI